MGSIFIADNSNRARKYPNTNLLTSAGQLRQRRGGNHISKYLNITNAEHHISEELWLNVGVRLGNTLLLQWGYQPENDYGEHS